MKNERILLTHEHLLRINVVGSSGSGKTTFARRLAEKLNSPYIEMDHLFWKPNWEQPSDDVFFPRLEKALAGSAWVLDGNYNRTNAIKWKDATLIIWIEPSLVKNR